MPTVSPWGNYVLGDLGIGPGGWAGGGGGATGTGQAATGSGGGGGGGSGFSFTPETITSYGTATGDLLTSIITGIRGGVAPPPVAPTAMSPVTPILMIAALGVGGYFLIRMLRRRS